MQLAKLLEAYRKHHKLSLRVMARKIGIEPTGLHRFEHGHQITAEKWVAIVKWALTTE